MLLNYKTKIKILLKKSINIFLFFVFVETVFAQEHSYYPWRQKLVVNDFAGNYKGWVEVFISTCSDISCIKEIFPDSYLTTFSSKTINYLTKNFSNLSSKYCAIIVTDTDLPFWFFAGKSKTVEIEFYDEKFFPVESKFFLVDKNTEFEIDTKNFSDNFEIIWQSSKGKTKQKILPVVEKNVLTPGNLRNSVMLLDLEKPDNKTFFLLDKFKLETKKVIISSHGKKVANNLETYRIDVEINFFGKFTFWIDKDYNVIFGEGMGIKVFPEK